MEDEAIRDLIRCRDDARHASRKAKQRLLSFLLKPGKSYNGRSNWSKAHYNWLSDVKMEHPAQQIALQEYIASVEETRQRVLRLTGEIGTYVRDWRLAPAVTAIQGLRGVSLLTAATVIAELGPLGRFATPKQLMSYLGLVPSLYSTGTTVRHGGITKTGNGFARRALVEAAWTYRFQARVTRHLRKRGEGLPREVTDIAWKAQLRLCDRFRVLLGRGKPKQVVTTAIARELIAFIWAIYNTIAPGLDLQPKARKLA